MDSDAILISRAVVLTLADIKVEVEAFANGDVNAFDAMDAICIAVDAYRATAPNKTQGDVTHKDAA